MKTTLCWNCKTAYSIEAEKCQSCSATNANFDLAQAQIKISENESLDAENTKLLYLLRGARDAMRKALPFCPPDKEAHYIGEWLDELNEELAKHENLAVK